MKKYSDKAEEKERKEMESAQAVVFARREAKYRQQQQAELQALLKRIECRRKEHIKQRNLDSKRLLQRNRNVQAVLEQKQSLECQRLFEEIKKTLISNGGYLLTKAGQAGGLAARSAAQDGRQSAPRSPGGGGGMKMSSPMPEGLDGGGSIAGGNGNVFPEAEGNMAFDPEFMQQQDADFRGLVQ